MYRVLLALLVAGFFVPSAHAANTPLVITLKDSRFSPSNLVVPAHQKVKITVKNLNTTPAEFESYELNREKVVAAGDEITVFVGPLEAGSYGYFNDFDRDAAKGTITAK